MEALTLSFSLQRMREWLGPDHPLVRKLLIKDSPDTLATRLVAEPKLDAPAERSFGRAARPPSTPPKTP